MVFGGFGVAVAVLFLLVYFVPSIMRGKQAFIDAPVDERFAEDLRLITSRTLTQTEGHARIFLSERTMTTSVQPSKLRAAARDRSRARARIAKRAANTSRGIALGLGIVVLTVVFWVLAGVTAFPTAIAIASTVVGGLYLAGFGYLVSVMAKADEEDRERINRANRALGESKRLVNAEFSPVETAVVAKAPLAEQTAEGHPETVAKPAETRTEKTAAVVTEDTSEVSKPTTVADRPATTPRKARATAFSAPSYTIKPTIVKRTVKPYEAPAAPESTSRFRPTRLNERIGDEVLDAPNAAPAMTGNEELRSDVLGGGSTLDALLDRRRA